MTRDEISRNDIIDKDEVLKMARQAGLGNIAGGVDGLDELKAFAKIVASAAIAKEREIYDHDTRVLMDALWKSCGDDEEVVRETIDSQGILIRGEA